MLRSVVVGRAFAGQRIDAVHSGCRRLLSSAAPEVTESDRDCQRELLGEFRQHLHQSRLWKIQDTAHLIMGFQKRQKVRNMEVYLVVPDSKHLSLEQRISKNSLPNLQSRGLQNLLDFYKEPQEKPLEIPTANDGPMVQLTKEGVRWTTFTKDDDKEEEEHFSIPATHITSRLLRFTDDIIAAHDDFEEEMDFRALNNIVAYETIYANIVKEAKEGDDNANSPLVNMMQNLNVGPHMQIREIQEAYGFSDADVEVFRRSKQLPRNSRRPYGRLGETPKQIYKRAPVAYEE